MAFRLQLDPAGTVREFAEISGRLVRGSEILRSVKDQEVEVGTTPKKEAFRIDKTVLYRYDAVAAPTIRTPVLVVYGLVGRYTMADLQEDRSLVRNLLAQGRRLGKPYAHRPLAHDRRLRRRLPRGVRRPHLRGARHRPGHAARHLRGRRVHRVLRGAAP
jgi:hypothetical protein